MNLDIKWMVKEAHQGGIMQLVWLDDSSFATASNDKTVGLWKEGVLQSYIKMRENPTLDDFQVGICAHGSRLVSVSLDGSINQL